MLQCLDTVFLGIATIENERATVAINLMCEQMYTITAGGIAMMNSGNDLIGPRFRRETVSAPACSVSPSPSPMSNGKSCILKIELES